MTLLVGAALTVSACGGAIGSGPAGLKKLAAELQRVAGPIVASAPAAIKPDVQQLFSFDEQFFAELAKVGYDYTKLTPTELQSFSAAATKVGTAVTAVDRYLVSDCGLPIPTTPTT